LIRFDFFQRQNTINNEKKAENIKAFTENIDDKLILMEKHTVNFEMMRKIDKMRKEIFYIGENINNNTNLIEILKKTISQKQNDIQLCSSILNMCKDNYKEKKNNVELEK
jgi:flagellar biosynthesis chaperone FliJ